MRRGASMQRSLWAKVGGRAMHARMWVASPQHAARPPIVLVHGLIISSAYMVPTARLLAGRFPVFAPDLPGFGLSPGPPEPLAIDGLAAALLAWLEAFDLERPVLVGNSVGAQVVAELAAWNPAAAGGLVLAGP